METSHHSILSLSPGLIRAVVNFLPPGDVLNLRMISRAFRDSINVPIKIPLNFMNEASEIFPLLDGNLTLRPYLMVHTFEINTLGVTSHDHPMRSILSKIQIPLPQIRNLSIICSTDPIQVELIKGALLSFPEATLKSLKIEVQGNERYRSRSHSDGVSLLINREPEVLSRFHGLNSLGLSGIGFYSGNLFNSLAKLPLTKLKLGSRDRPVPGTYPLTNNLVKLGSLTSLTLHLQMCTYNLEDEEDSRDFEVLAMLPLLKKLTISKPKVSGDVALLKLDCPDLCVDRK